MEDQKLQDAFNTVVVALEQAQQKGAFTLEQASMAFKGLQDLKVFVETGLKKQTKK